MVYYIQLHDVILVIMNSFRFGFKFEQILETFIIIMYIPLAECNQNTIYQAVSLIRNIILKCRILRASKQSLYF